MAQFVNLKELELSYCRNITTSQFEYLFQRCSQLRSLSLSGNEQLPGNEIADSISLHCKNLTYLNLFGTKVSYDGIKKIVQNCSQLSQLYIPCYDPTFGSDYYGDRFKEIIDLCPQLTVLEIERKIKDDDEVEYLAKKCPHFKKLIFKNGDFSKETISEMVCLPSLTSLTILEATSSNLKNFLLHCPRLIELHIGSTFLTDFGLDVVGEYCHKLEKLCIENANITSKGLLELAQNCPKLTRLEIRKCSDVDVSTFIQYYPRLSIVQS